MKTPRILAIAVLLLTALPATAQVPGILNYQGRVAVGTVNFDGNGQFKFALVNANGSTTYWSNDGTSTAGSQPTGAVPLSVTKGLYSVLLGETTLTNMAAVPASVFNNTDVRLRVWFNDGVNGFQQLSPDQRIAAVGYAMTAGGVNLPATSSASSGVISQNGTSLMHSYGSNNLFAGLGAGNFTMTGTYNTASGVAALQSNTGGSDITALGYFALNKNTTGNDNTAIGYSALSSSSTGTRNTAAGSFAMYSNTTGNYNTAAGFSALGQNTGGTNNTALGDSALFGNIVGVSNTALGNAALLHSTSNNNTAAGAGALGSTTTGSSNSAVGSAALGSNTTGSNNIALGISAGQNLTTGSNNIDIGNLGIAGESNIIRIGTSGTHTDTYLTGVIHGDGSGLTGVTASIPAGSITGTQIATSTITSGNISAGAVGSTQLASNLALGGTTSGTFSGTLSGNASTATTATTAASFSGSLAGNVTGTQGATVVSSVGASTAANVHSAELLANAATNANTAGTIVKRDGAGSFFAGTITATFVGDGSGLTNVPAGAVTGNFNIPGTSGSNVGVITQGGAPLIHTYGNSNFFAAGAGNFSLNATSSNGTLGSYNIGIGGSAIGAGSALAALSNGENNIALGSAAMAGTTNGNDNTAIGVRALVNNITGNNNVAIGSASLSNTQANDGNVAIGYMAGYSVASAHNIAIGDGAMGTASYTSTGQFNVAVGSSALYANSTGDSNSAVGISALNRNTTGSSNAALGTYALNNNNTGSNNTAAGWKVLYSNVTGSGNAAFGYTTMQNNQGGHDNTACGTAALTANTSGNNNTAVGESALGANTTGIDNTAVGFQALLNSTTTSANIALGYQAGINTTGTGNIIIGNPGAALESNVIRMGIQGTHTSTFVAGIAGATASGGSAVFVNASGQLGTQTSSRRFKEKIQDMAESSRCLLSLRPVTFRYKPEIDPKSIPQWGLIAEEVNEVNPDLVVQDEKGVIQTVRYEQLNAMLLNEFLKDHRQLKAVKAKQEAEIKERDAKIATLEKRLAELEAKDQAREARLAKLEQFIPEARKPKSATAANLNPN